LGSVDGEPVLLETFWFDADVFEGLDQIDLESASLSETVLDRYRMEVTSAEQQFSVRTLEAKDAKLLDINQRTSVLHVERLLHFRSATNAAFVQMDCRSDRFSFSQNIFSEGPTRGGA
jgi:GntR family transcriptional regulator